jgi:hypothetical protein
MKTTLDIPETLLRRVKARAALKGGSMREFFVDAVEDKLRAEGGEPERVRGWRTVFGKLPKGATAAVDTTLQGEFESVDPEAWQ